MPKEFAILCPFLTLIIYLLTTPIISNLNFQIFKVKRKTGVHSRVYWLLPLQLELYSRQAFQTPSGIHLGLHLWWKMT